VIAGQIAAGRRKGGVQLAGKRKIVRIARRTEGKIARVDDEIGTPRVDMFADPMKIVGQLLMAAGEVSIGNLGQAKFGHATLRPGPIIYLSATEW
jgi:hypothetical protein